MVTKRCPPREGKQSETRTNDLRDRLVSLCKEEEEGRKKKEETRAEERKGKGKRNDDESGARALRRRRRGKRRRGGRSFSEIGSCKFRSRPGNSEKRRQFALSQPLSRGSVMKRTVMRRPPDLPCTQAVAN